MELINELKVFNAKSKIPKLIRYLKIKTLTGKTRTNDKKETYLRVRKIEGNGHYCGSIVEI